MNFWLLAFIIIAFSWTALVGVVRAEFLRARNFEYVLAAKALTLMNSKKITSLSVYNKKNKLKTIGVIHIHNILASDIV